MYAVDPYAVGGYVNLKLEHRFLFAPFQSFVSLFPKSINTEILSNF